MTSSIVWKGTLGAVVFTNHPPGMVKIPPNFHECVPRTSANCCSQFQLGTTPVSWFSRSIAVIPGNENWPIEAQPGMVRPPLGLKTYQYLSTRVTRLLLYPMRVDEVQLPRPYT